MHKRNKKKNKSKYLLPIIVYLSSLLRKSIWWIIVTIIAFVLGNMISPMVGPEIHIAPPLSKGTKIIVNHFVDIGDNEYQIDYYLIIRLINKSIIPGFVDQFEIVPIVEFPINYNFRYHFMKKQRLIYNTSYEYHIEMTTRIKGKPGQNYGYFKVVMFDNCKQRIICDKDLVLIVRTINNIKDVKFEFRDKVNLEWIAPAKE